MSAMASQITSLTIVYSTVNSDTDERKHQSSASLAFVRGIHRGPANYPHKGPVTRKMFPFDDVIMKNQMNVPGIFDRCAAFMMDSSIWRLEIRLTLCVLNFSEGKRESVGSMSIRCRSEGPFKPKMYRNLDCKKKHYGLCSRHAN